MTAAIPASAALVGGYSLVQLAIFAVIACAVVGIVLIAARASGVAIPDWVVRIGWIVLVAVVAILAIRFVASL